MLKPLLIRADANAKVGSGHVMRCLALAQEWKRRGRDVMFFGDIDNAIGKRILAEKCALRTNTDANTIFDLANKIKASWVIVDGYQFNIDYQKTLRGFSSRVLIISDFKPVVSHCADIILNQNINAKEVTYVNSNTGTQFLLGTKYAMLRKEFLHISESTRKRDIPKAATSLLITMGGADLDNVTTKIIRALNLIDTPLQPTIIIGGSNRHYKEIFKAVGESKHSFHIHLNVTDMQNHILWSDLAISAGGSTCWELAYLGTPMALVTLSDNQDGNVQGLRDREAAYSLRWLSLEDMAQQISQLIQDQEWRTELQENAQKLVDGDGANRVVNAMIGAER